MERVITRACHPQTNKYLVDEKYLIFDDPHWTNTYLILKIFIIYILFPVFDSVWVIDSKNITCFYIPHRHIFCTSCFLYFFLLFLVFVCFLVFPLIIHKDFICTHINLFLHSTFYLKTYS